MRRSKMALLVVLALLVLAGCSGREDSGGDGRSERAGGAASVMELLWAGEESPIGSFGYMDSCSVWDGAEHSDLVLDTGHSELTGRLREILDQVLLDVDRAQPLDGEPDVSAWEEYLYFEISLHDETAFLAVGVDGTVYLSRSTDGPEGFQVEYDQYSLVDGGQYNFLRREMDRLCQYYRDSLALSLEVFIAPSTFLPDSSVIRVWVVNNGSRPVGFDREFVLERRAQDGWEQVPASPDVRFNEVLQLVKPGETRVHGVSLSYWQDANREGEYRLTNTFQAGDDAVELALEFAVSADALDRSNPVRPAMQGDHQDYYNRYLSAWGFYCPFQEDFSQAAPLAEFHPYLLYSSSLYQEGGAEEIYEAYPDGNIPAEMVDAVVARHWGIATQAFRDALGAQNSASEYYDEVRDVYHFTGGYGGAAFSGVVTGAERNGDLLTLDCDWYSVDDSFVFSHTVTIRLGDGEKEFFYLSNTVRERAQ